MIVRVGVVLNRTVVDSNNYDVLTTCQTQLTVSGTIQNLLMDSSKTDKDVMTEQPTNNYLTTNNHLNNNK